VKIAKLLLLTFLAAAKEFMSVFNKINLSHDFLYKYTENIQIIL